MKIDQKKMIRHEKRQRNKIWESVLGICVARAIGMREELVKVQEEGEGGGVNCSLFKFLVDYSSDLVD